MYADQKISRINCLILKITATCDPNNKYIQSVPFCQLSEYWFYLQPDGPDTNFVDNADIDKPICPHCGGKETIPRPLRHRHNCKKCRKDFTCRKGTVFDNSRLPLKNGYMRFTCYKLRVKAIAS